MWETKFCSEGPNWVVTLWTNLEKMNDMNTYDFLKSIAAAAGGWLAAALMPAAPYGMVRTVMVIADVVSARRLAHRLGRQMPTKRQQLKFSSARFGRTVSKLCRIYGLLTLAALLQHTFGGDWCDLLKWSAAIVCFWQGCSIIENEASANASPWAKIAGKILVDKTSRHLGIEPEDLAEIIKIDDEIKTKNPKNQENNC